jgi:hypothetical protein
MQSWKTPLLTTALTACAFAGTAAGELVAYDPFLSGDNRGAGEYTAGSSMTTMGAAAFGWVGLSGQPDGFGVAHSGTTSNFQANAAGEDSAAVNYEQGGRMQWIGAPSAFDRHIERQLNPTVASNEWWMSIMVNRLAWSTSNTSFAVGGFTDDANNGLQVGYDNSAGDDNPDLILRVAGQNIVLAADTASSDNQLVIVRLDVVAGLDTISVWIDPDNVNDAADLVLTNIDLTDSTTPFTQSRYESPGSSGNTFFDEVRLATTFEAVTGVPEPGSLALLGLGGLAMLRRRR